MWHRCRRKEFLLAHVNHVHTDDADADDDGDDYCEETTYRITQVEKDRIKTAEAFFCG